MSPISLVFLALCGLALGTESQVSALDGRIVGGKPTTVEEYPYQLSLRKSGRHWCGGSIISPNYALIAAHCVPTGNPENVTIHAGTSYRDVLGSIHIPKKITVHPNYAGFDYDYAIVEVDTPFPIGQSGIQSIELCSVEPSAGETAVISGWGLLSAGGSSPNQLQVVNVLTLSRETCQKRYSVSQVTERMICAGAEKDGKDACNGDSGGPLVVNGKVCGVVSWSIGCGQAKYPHVYANVANQRSWIKEITGI